MSVTIELLQRQNRELREQLEERDETIRQLREAASSGIAIPEWMPHLTATERLMLAIFADGKVHSRENVMDRLYGDRTEAPISKIVDVYIIRLRRKLAPLGIQIETLWGQGWRLTPESIALMRAEATHNTNSVSGGTAQPIARPAAEVATAGGILRSQS
jgi:DNA-binding response OmpR family regulator